MGLTMLNLKHYAFDTYTQCYLEDWKTVVAVIDKHTKQTKELLEDAPQKTGRSLIDQRQLDDALNGPFSLMITRHIQARAKLKAIEIALSLSEKDAYKPEDLPENITMGCDTAVLKNTEISTILTIKKSLDSLLKEHEMQWESHISEWHDKLTHQLAEAALDVSENEIAEFLTSNPVSELNETFTDLKLPTAKVKNPPFSFKDYFKLKLIIIIHSALSRMHLPNTETDIQQYLKKLKDVLKEIAHAEDTLQKTQQAELSQTLDAVTVER